MQSFRTPLSRARGLGSAKHGVGSWILERVIAAALVPLVIWGVVAAVRLSGADYPDSLAWVRASLLNPVLLVLLSSISFWHMHAGLRVVIEDYIHRPLTKAALLLCNVFVSTLAAVLVAFCILKVALGGV
jgi:succinate dehydrogenase / fumarate reductase membrane anchor subunit